MARSVDVQVVKIGSNECRLNERKRLRGALTYVDVPIVAYGVLLRANARRSPGALGESEKGKKEGDSR